MSRIVRAQRAVIAAAPIAALVWTVALAGPQPSTACAPPADVKPWADTRLSPECRAQFALAAMTREERIAFRGTNERLGLISPPGSDGPNGVIGGGIGAEQTPVPGVQVPGVWHWSAVQTTDAPAVHVPVWQVSCVQRLPSRSHEEPLPFATGAGHPVAAAHDPMVWHWSVLHVTVGPSVHTPA